ncbi:MAG: hypothetical protein ACI9FR_000662 [Cryomorphaceae bacterium]|jgi:uncharacterized protein YdiU (UPF0061 family)
MKLKFDNHFVNELPADATTGSARRQVHNAAYSFVDPAKVSDPTLVSFSRETADLLDLSEADCQSDEFLHTFVGNQQLEGMQPYAMCYGGHQFGNWAGQLGDGRAINLGQVLNASGQSWAIQLKGSGATPYSRTADGLAVLRSSIREYLCSEAMFHLGVPTTRALSLINTGENVMRDVLYDGHPEYEPGSVVCRVAPSFIRFGSFQIFASRGEVEELRELADYTIEHHFVHLKDQHSVGSKEIYAAWFKQVCETTVTMVVDWMRLGFVHGVMNTDNMSILGLTIDYGPYGWLDDFNPEWTPNTTDAQNRRYRYSQQANIALWNCYQLANALFPLLEETEALEAALSDFQSQYQDQWRAMMATKLGFAGFQEGDELLFERLEKLLATVETDMTLFYRALASDDLTMAQLQNAYYAPDDLGEDYVADMQAWITDYQYRVQVDGLAAELRISNMNKVNPKFIFRNYIAQQAIDLAEEGDYSMVNELLEVLRKPYQEQVDYERYAAKRPEWARSKVGCSMLSCSS